MSERKFTDGYKGDKSYMMENNFIYYFPEYVNWLEETLEETAALAVQRGETTNSVGRSYMDVCKELQSVRAELEAAKATIASLRNAAKPQQRMLTQDDLDYVPEHDVFDDR